MMPTHKNKGEATKPIFQCLQATGLPLFNIFNEETKYFFFNKNTPLKKNLFLNQKGSYFPKAKGLAATFLSPYLSHWCLHVAFIRNNSWLILTSDYISELGGGGKGLVNNQTGFDYVSLTSTTPLYVRTLVTDNLHLWTTMMFLFSSWSFHCYYTKYVCVFSPLSRVYFWERGYYLCTAAGQGWRCPGKN